MDYALLKDVPRSLRRFMAVAALACLLVGVGIGIAIGWSVKPTQTASSQGSASIDTASSPSRPQFLLLGDSITQWGANVTNEGWVSRLQADYAVSADVINRGRQGHTTRACIDGVLPTLRKDVLGSWIQPTLVTLWLGANDAVDPAGIAGGIHVPINEYKKNLARILNEVKALAPTAKIVLLTPSPVDDVMRRDLLERSGYARDPPDRTNQVVATYAAGCKQVGEATPGVTVLDIYGHIMATYPNATDRKVLTLDGLHLPSAGNAAVFALMNEQIKALVPQFAGRTTNDWKNSFQVIEGSQCP